LPKAMCLKAWMKTRLIDTACASVMTMDIALGVK